MLLIWLSSVTSNKQQNCQVEVRNILNGNQSFLKSNTPTSQSRWSCLPSSRGFFCSGVAHPSGSACIWFHPPRNSRREMFWAFLQPQHLGSHGWNFFLEFILGRCKLSKVPQIKHTFYRDLLLLRPSSGNACCLFLSPNAYWSPTANLALVLFTEPTGLDPSQPRHGPQGSGEMLLTVNATHRQEEV